jgi:hypothetical protein
MLNQANSNKVWVSDEVIRFGMKFTVIEIPTSAIKLKAYGISPADAVRRAADAVGHAKAHGIYVTFFPRRFNSHGFDFFEGNLPRHARCRGG